MPHFQDQVIKETVATMSGVFSSSSYPRRQLLCCEQPRGESLQGGELELLATATRVSLKVAPPALSGVAQLLRVSA